MCFEDLEPVKRFTIIESQVLCPISSERSIRSRAETTCNHGVSTLSECDSGTNGAKTDESFENVRSGCGSEGLGLIRREVDARQ